MSASPMNPIGSQGSSPSSYSEDSRLEMAVVTVIGLAIIIAAKIALIYFLIWVLSCVT